MSKVLLYVGLALCLLKGCLALQITFDLKAVETNPFFPVCAEVTCEDFNNDRTISNISIYKAAPDEIGLNTDNMQETPFVVLTQEKPIIKKRNPGGSYIEGSLYGGVASLKLELSTQEECKAEYICQIIATDGEGREHVSTIRASHQRDTKEITAPQTPAQYDGMGRLTPQTPAQYDGMSRLTPQTPAQYDGMGRPTPQTPTRFGSLGRTVPQTPTRFGSLGRTATRTPKAGHEYFGDFVPVYTGEKREGIDKDEEQWTPEVTMHIVSLIEQIQIKMSNWESKFDSLTEQMNRMQNSFEGSAGPSNCKFNADFDVLVSQISGAEKDFDNKFRRLDSQITITENRLADKIFSATSQLANQMISIEKRISDQLSSTEQRIESRVTSVETRLGDGRITPVFRPLKYRSKDAANQTVSVDSYVLALREELAFFREDFTSSFNDRFDVFKREFSAYQPSNMSSLQDKHLLDTIASLVNSGGHSNCSASSELHQIRDEITNSFNSSFSSLKEMIVYRTVISPDSFSNFSDFVFYTINQTLAPRAHEMGLNNEISEEISQLGQDISTNLNASLNVVSKFFFECMASGTQSFENITNNLENSVVQTITNNLENSVVQTITNLTSLAKTVDDILDLTKKLIGKTQSQNTSDLSYANVSECASLGQGDNKLCQMITSRLAALELSLTKDGELSKIEVLKELNDIKISISQTKRDLSSDVTAAQTSLQNAIKTFDNHVLIAQQSTEQNLNSTLTLIATGVAELEHHLSSTEKTLTNNFNLEIGGVTNRIASMEQTIVNKVDTAVNLSEKDDDFGSESYQTPGPTIISRDTTTSELGLLLSNKLDDLKILVQTVERDLTSTITSLVSSNINNLKFDVMGIKTQITGTEMSLIEQMKGIEKRLATVMFDYTQVNYSIDSTHESSVSCNVYPSLIAEIVRGELAMLTTEITGNISETLIIFWQGYDNDTEDNLVRSGNITNFLKSSISEVLEQISAMNRVCPENDDGGPPMQGGDKSDDEINDSVFSTSGPKTESDTSLGPNTSSDSTNTSERDTHIPSASQTPGGNTDAPKIATHSPSASQTPGGNTDAPKIATHSPSAPQTTGGNTDVPKIATHSTSAPNISGGSTDAPKIAPHSPGATQTSSESTDTPKKLIESIVATVVPALDELCEDLYPLFDTLSKDFKLDAKGSLDMTSCKRGMLEVSPFSLLDYALVRSDPNSGLLKPTLCDTETEGGGWLLVQRRKYGNISFDRSWEDYKFGFGTLCGDFWLGLETLYKLTSVAKYELRLDIRTRNGREYHDTYGDFSIESEDGDYALHVGISKDDSMQDFNGRPFQTYDRYTGKACDDGWWHQANDCDYSMNSRFHARNPLVFAEMRIRRHIEQPVLEPFMACNESHWGTDCSQKCTCLETTTTDCDEVTGACICASGFTGLNCEKCSEPGYTVVDGVCVDFDECMSCQTHNCTAHQQCVNTEGHYTCQCKPGFISDGVSCSEAPSGVSLVELSLAMDIDEPDPKIFDNSSCEFAELAEEISQKVMESGRAVIGYELLSSVVICFKKEPLVVVIQTAIDEPAGSERAASLTTSLAETVLEDMGLNFTTNDAKTVGMSVAEYDVTSETKSCDIFISQYECEPGYYCAKVDKVTRCQLKPEVLVTLHYVIAIVLGLLAFLILVILVICCTCLYGKRKANTKKDKTTTTSVFPAGSAPKWNAAYGGKDKPFGSKTSLCSNGSDNSVEQIKNPDTWSLQSPPAYYSNTGRSNSRDTTGTGLTGASGLSKSSVGTLQQLRQLLKPEEEFKIPRPTSIEPEPPVQKIYIA